MVVDAANSNGPFPPAALLHIRGEPGRRRNPPRALRKWPLCSAPRGRKSLPAERPGAADPAPRAAASPQPRLRRGRGALHAQLEAGCAAVRRPSPPPPPAVLMSKDVKSLAGKVLGGGGRRGGGGAGQLARPPEWPPPPSALPAAAGGGGAGLGGGMKASRRRDRRRTSLERVAFVPAGSLRETPARALGSRPLPS